MRTFKSFENPNQAAGGINMGNTRPAKALRRSGGCCFETWFPPARDPPLRLVLELLKGGRLWKTLVLRLGELIFKSSMIEYQPTRDRICIFEWWFGFGCGWLYIYIHNT